MLTIRLQEPGRFVALPDSPSPARQSGEALVKVHRIGICGTDLHAYAGRQPFFEYPRVLGHELGVEVLEVDASNPQGLRAGDRCCVEPYLSCSRCGACRRGKTNCCEQLQVLGVHTDGGMCQTLSLPTSTLHPSEVMTYDQLALVETLCIGAHAVERAIVQPGERCLVLGVGPIGLSVIQCLQVAGAQVIVADVNESRLAFARQTLGIAHTLNVTEGSMEERLRELCDGDLPAAIFDATGHPASMMGCFDLVAFGGRVVFVGLFKGDVTFHDPLFHRREVTLLASRNATAQTFANVMKWVSSGQLNTDPWITHRLKLAQLPATFDGIAKQPDLIKAMIEVDC